jgi:ABC-type branched-subunit amino acid transport system substrate-binding protein
VTPPSLSSVRIGALAPLSPPGWAEAGRHLLAGLELAVDEVNEAGGVAGRAVELLVRDTAADPEKAEAAVRELVGLGVVALVGEYHSVVARRVATTADALALPFLCSSAVLDRLVDRPTRWVARLPPPQSHGWRRYADFLLDAGHRRVAVVPEPSLYWASGAEILRDRFAARDASAVVIDARALTPAAVCAQAAREEATALLLLVGHPEPAVSIVRAARGETGPVDLFLGAPAGQPELPDWLSLLGAAGAGIPFLRYLPEEATPLGSRVAQALARRLGAPPSFVAFEGYDSVVVLAAVLRAHGTDPEGIAEAWSQVAVLGTRGEIRFTRTPDTGVWQWATAPIQIADRDPEHPDRFRVLRA